MLRVLSEFGGFLNWVKVCVITPPKDQKNWKEIMHDLAILTGSQVS